jgi:hypothetical protein
MFNFLMHTGLRLSGLLAKAFGVSAAPKTFGVGRGRFTMFSSGKQMGL